MIRPSRQNGRNLRISSAASFRLAVAMTHCKKQSIAILRG
jgi:hypothetical protein